MTEREPNWTIWVCPNHGIIPEDDIIEGQELSAATADNPDGFTNKFYCPENDGKEVMQVDLIWMRKEA